MPAKYDSIGTRYSVTRRTDPYIAKQLHAHLGDASRILNIGAGTGSYEPKHCPLVAVEPSAVMIAQRSDDAHPVYQAAAEALPFDDDSFSHTMTVLSMHHWQARNRAFQEIQRVTTAAFVAITWDPDTEPFWLTRDYFPEIYIEDQKIFPPLAELTNYFDDVQVHKLAIPADCVDGLLAAFWKRPEAYLQSQVQQATSAFAGLENLEKGLGLLEEELANGRWAARNHSLLEKHSLDVGYRLITAKIPSAGTRPSPSEKRD